MPENAFSGLNGVHIVEGVERTILWLTVVEDVSQLK